MDLSQYLLEVFNSEQQTELFDKFLRAIPDFVYLLDLRDGKITYLNDKTGVIAHYTEEEVLSLDKDFFPVKNFDDRNVFIEKINELFKNTTEGDHRSFTLELITKEGKFHLVRNRATLLKKNSDGIPTKVVVIAEDITVETEREKELEHKIFELNRSNQELEQFAYVASHDLQEPLRKIISFGDRLSTRFSEELGTDGQFYISRMLIAASRMRILMDNLFSYSRASRKVEPLETVDLELIITEVLGDLETKIQEIDAKINVGKMPTIQALPIQMQQLFQNLISNALKFVKPDQQPLISIKSQEVVGDELKSLGIPLKFDKYHKIVVADKGIGFDAQYAEKIFVIFQRLHGRSEFEGTGLGLAICKKIVDNHQGHIMAKATMNEGAEFTIYLPDYELNIKP